MEERTLIPARDLDEHASYRLLTGLILPRPIAWVSTLDGEGTLNLAPFSFFTGASIVPPMVLVVIEPHKDRRKKDTLGNIEATGEFVVNTVVQGLPGAASISAMDFAKEESEFERTGLTPSPSEFVRPPGVAESPVNMECKLERTILAGSAPHTLVLGEVLAFRLRPDILEPSGRVNFAALKPVGRMAGDVYVRCTDLLTKPRKDWRASSY